jgi:hypothetical protein
MIDAHVRERVRPLLVELDSLARLTSERGVTLVVMPINEQRPDGRFDPSAARADSLVADFCRARGVSVFDHSRRSPPRRAARQSSAWGPTCTGRRRPTRSSHASWPPTSCGPAHSSTRRTRHRRKNR